MQKSANSNTGTRVFAKADAIDFVAEALRRNPAKQIARQIDASPRTVEGWKGRKVAMSLAHFLNAMQAIPELRAEVLGLLKAEAELSPELEYAINAAVQRAMRRE